MNAPRGALPLATVGIAILDAMSFFWSFIHDRAPPTAETNQAYVAHRRLFLDAWATIPGSILPPCLHYITNHLFEDRQFWESLFWFIGEATEASHARDNRMKKGTLRGRVSANDKWSTWAIMLRNFCALKDLQRQGVIRSFVTCPPLTSALLTADLHRMPEELREHVAPYLHGGASCPAHIGDRHQASHSCSS